MLVVTVLVLFMGIATRRYSLANLLILQLLIACFLSVPLSHWPLRIRFWLSAPSLNGFVHSIEANSSDNSPRWIGLFHVDRVDRERYEACILLVTNDNPVGPSGLLFGPKELSQNPGNEWHGISMTEEWRYTIED